MLFHHGRKTDEPSAPSRELDIKKIREKNDNSVCAYMCTGVCV